MWCCFTPNKVIEPTVPKPLATDVPVVVKPVTLMFRLPSDEKEEQEVQEVDLYEDVEPVQEDSPCNTYSLMLAAGILTVLYLLMDEKKEL